MFAGSLLRNYVEPWYLLELLSAIESRLHIRLTIHAAGNAVNVVDAFEEKLDIHRTGWVPHDTLSEEYENTDVLVSIAEKSGRQPSSKIIEYMCTGKPILHIFYHRNDVNLPYLKRYPLALCVLADEAAIGQNARQTAEWIQRVRSRRVPFEYTEMVFHEMTPAYLAEQVMRKEMGSL